MFYKHRGSAPGEQFDDVLRDSPNQIRPPAIVMFWGHEQCQKEFDALAFDKLVEEKMPSRERLFAAKYRVHIPFLFVSFVNPFRKPQVQR